MHQADINSILYTGRIPALGACNLLGRQEGAMSQSLGWQPPHVLQLELF